MDVDGRHLVALCSPMAMLRLGAWGLDTPVFAAIFLLIGMMVSQQDAPGPVQGGWWAVAIAVALAGVAILLSNLAQSRIFLADTRVQLGAVGLAKTLDLSKLLHLLWQARRLLHICMALVGLAIPAALLAGVSPSADWVEVVLAVCVSALLMLAMLRLYRVLKAIRAAGVTALELDIEAEADDAAAHHA